MIIIFILLNLFLLLLLFFFLNHFILTKLSNKNKLRIWWEKEICTTKDLENPNK
jgi:uncharacterized membrane protein